MTTLQILAAGSGFISAGLWFWASVLNFPAPAAYLSGAPDHVLKRIKLIGRLNAGGAAFAGLAITLQSIVSLKF
ncbi:hypothetical protein [Aquamicrobium defluvii]|uniref:hypothetical protein n=1 Tax=Aquamicrobium defluvii TaxID=69279 RepID=UPI00105C9F2F|nr:hypothetical protein [Aquamicrobium defluvii]